MKINYIDIDHYTLKVGIKKNEDSQHFPLLFLNGISTNLEMLQPFFNKYNHSDIISLEMPELQGIRDKLSLRRMKKYASLINKLLDKLGYDKVCIVGYSWGGALTQEFAHSYPNRCEKIILAATSPGQIMVPGSMFFSPRLLNLKLLTDPKELGKLLAGNPNEKAAKKVLAELPKSSNTPTKSSSSAFVHQLLANVGWSSLPWLWSISQPALVIHAKDDPLVSSINSDIISSLLPNAQLIKYETGGHTFIVKHMDDFIEKISNFIIK